MRRSNIYLIVILITAILSLFIYMYVFNIYEVTVSVKPRELFADGKSTVNIEAVPLNSFGKKVPFRYVKTTFQINAGKELVTIVSKDVKRGTMILKAGFSAGKVEVIVKPEKSLLPSLVEIPVNPNYAGNNNF